MRRISKIWGISVSLAEDILSTTTQRGISALSGLIVRRFRTRQAYLR